jgi:hypothetical protein
MSALSFDSLISNTQMVLASKSTSNVLYLDKAGACQKELDKRASIVELFYRSKSFSEISVSDGKKWHEYVMTVVKVLDEEYKSPEASFLFMRLVAPLGIRIFQSRFNESLNMLAVGNSWMTEHCMQDVFMVLMHDIKMLQREISVELAKLPEDLHPYFLNPHSSVKTEAIRALFSYRPQSPVGEILYSKLKAQKKEISLYFPYEKALGVPLFEFSTSKVTAFANPAFIEELKTTYPETEMAFDEIHAFTSLLKQFAHVYFLYKRHGAAMEVCVSFTNGYMPKIKDLKAESKMTLEERRPLIISRMAKHPFTVRMFDVVCMNMQANERLSKEAGFSDYRFDEDVDIKPFLDLTEEYFSSYHTFFLRHLSHLHGAMDFEKKKIYKMQTSREVSEELHIVASFNQSFISFLSEFKGPKIPEFLPSRETWQAYISNLRQFLLHAYKAPSLKAAAKETRSLKEAIHELMAPPAPMPAARGGGGGALEVLEEAVVIEEPVVPEEEQIASARALFGKSKHAKVVDLYAEIEKNPLDIVYASRITNWFTAQDEVLALEPYTHMSEQLQRKMVQIHAFSLKVDHFLSSKFSQQKVWVHKASGREDELYVIPGFMTFEGRSLRGVFEYCKNDEFYHRVFKELKSDESFSDYLDEPTFDYDKQFPTLHAAAKPKSKVFASCNGDFEVMIDAFGSAHFEDEGIAYTLLNLT